MSQHPSTSADEKKDEKKQEKQHLLLKEAKDKLPKLKVNQYVRFQSEAPPTPDANAYASKNPPKLMRADSTQQEQPDPETEEEELELDMDCSQKPVADPPSTQKPEPGGHDNAGFSQGWSTF